MLSSEEIRSVTFEKALRGYRAEDVDAFLEQTAAGVDQLIAEKEDIEKKLYILAQKVEEYRADEDTLKSALLNAQRLGENVIHEARSKGDSIIREATGKSPADSGGGRSARKGREGTACALWRQRSPISKVRF